jgi:DNA mismatch repair protein MutS
MDRKLTADFASQRPPVSVLFDGGPPLLEPDPPAWFADLNLDQVVDSIAAGREEYDLKSFFYTRLRSVDAIAYRHEVLRDLEREEVVAAVRSFAEGMREMRRRFDQMGKLHYQYEWEAWFRDAAESYCDAVSHLAEDLAAIEVRSRGLAAVREYLGEYVRSQRFTALASDTEDVKARLAEVRYCLEIQGGRIRVSRYEDEADYSAEVLETFEKFKQGAVKDYRRPFKEFFGLNHVEAAVLGLVARLYPGEFAALDAYCERHRDYVDELVGAFDREVQFYLAYLEYTERLRTAGLRFCYPRVRDDSKDVHARDAFDIALANALVPDGAEVVRSDFRLSDPERIIVVSGPNQGGKTTFARMFGQLHYFAAIGLPVPGADAQLYLCDELFTHFEREEDIATLSGKLEDELVRIHEILERATEDSVVIMNESFTSTTLQDALLLGRAVMEQMIERDLLCVYVTFVNELASLGETTVSMVSTVVPEDPATRTFKVVRRPADGLAYAAAIAEKYGLTYARVKERLA